MGEADRKILKAAIKHSSGEDQVRHRQIPTEAVAKWSKKLDDLKEEVSEILVEEKEEKHVSLSYHALTPILKMVFIVPQSRDGTAERTESD